MSEWRREIARPSQLAPAWSWFLWLILAGRGFGKTRAATEWLDEEARKSKRGDQVLLAGRTPADVRDYSLKGPGGLLTHHPDIEYQPSNRLLIWPNGVHGLIRSGENPEEFRGFSGEKALLEEFCAWSYPESCWNNLMFGMREREPQVVISTTPRPISTLKRIMKMPNVAVTRGTSYENRSNLSARWVANVLDPLEGTRLGRQEIGAELLEDVQGALWTLTAIDATRRRPEDVPQLVRVVVGVDPQGSKMVGHETGIVGAGLGVDRRIYVLADESINGTPGEWGNRAVATYERLKADRIVGERNFGGDMVETTIRAVKSTVSYSNVTASRGKQQRAEPIAARYEKSEVSHVGTFPTLEDEMCGFVPGVGLVTDATAEQGAEPSADGRKRSPNRMDALVWAITALTDGPGAVTVVSRY